MDTLVTLPAAPQAPEAPAEADLGLRFDNSFARLPSSFYTRLLPVPLPFACQIYYGDPMKFEGDGSEPDDIINGYVEQVKQQIEAMIARGRQDRRDRVQASKDAHAFSSTK